MARKSKTLALILDGVRRALKKWLGRAVDLFEADDTIDWQDYANRHLRPELERSLQAAAVESAKGVFDVSWDRINEPVRALARRRAFELVTLDGPENIVRPTRDFLDRVREELATGELAWTDLSLRLQKMFGPYRARLIARTETTTLWADSHMIAAVEADMTHKRSRRATHRRPCPSSVCDDAEAEGWIPIRQPFRKSKKQGPAFHPGCYCDLHFKAVRSTTHR